jgi:hypothetical protein
VIVGDVHGDITVWDVAKTLLPTSELVEICRRLGNEACWND